MNAAFLLLPFLAVRFGLMAALGRDALQRAAHFAPMQGAQRVALVVYQVSNAAIFLGLFFFQVRPAAAWWFLGGRSLLFGGAWPVRGRGGQLCLAGPPWAEHGRGLPVFPQPHVCSLFYLLSWHGAAGKITFPGRGRAGVSAFRPLACACGRALVRGNIRGRV